MTKYLACTDCIATKGLKGNELDDLPRTEEGLAEHIESEHHIPVQRKDETEVECMERFQRENPEAGGPNCKCPDCQDNQAIWDLVYS